ncbi:hypothetical protein HMPREF1545_00368 [Oscillibacter sp. KLE 1728]|nr:hypothetical protein HMPREF1545_00368 [Oscillibacter sp. KLE 1728]ERK67159.1 hypothetical protein HMPREF1546_00666 [Oscillibacter sp. KLE 1745]
MMRIVEISASQDGKSFFVYCIANFKLGLCVIPFTLSHFFAENAFIPRSIMVYCICEVMA